MPVTNSAKWNRTPEDFEDFFGAEMLPALSHYEIEDDPVNEEIPQIAVPEIIPEIEETVKRSQIRFFNWLQQLALRMKNSAMRFQVKH